MGATVKGLLDWSLTREDDGSRSYEALWLVKTTDPMVGPNEVSFAAGLPAIGSSWSLNGDSDPWAFCMPYASVKRFMPKQGERNIWWTVGQKFSSPSKKGNKQGEKYCKDQQFEDPLSEPPKISGVFSKSEEPTDLCYSLQYQKGSTFDTEPQLSSPDGDGTDFGIYADMPIYMAIEGLTREVSIHDVSITLNRPTLYLDVIERLLDCTNDSELWGKPPSHVRFTGFSWEELYYGVCSRYYRYTMDFSIKRKGWKISLASRSPIGFDRVKIPNPVDPDPNGDPPILDARRFDVKNYDFFRNSLGEPVEGTWPVKANGEFYSKEEIASSKGTFKERKVTVELYPRKNLLELGIPSTLT